MKLCFPATRDLGLDSPVSRHFGSVPNGRVVHEHGAR